ncbi:MAG: sulfatase, partial [Myxococcota bacterium]
AEWSEGSVDLSSYAGKAIRLELEIQGMGEGAGWGEPEVMIPEGPEAPEIADRRAVPKNLVYILIDTVRADVFEPIGGEGSKVHTPTFDALTKDSIVFSRAFAHENWTKPSVATLLSGLYPTTHDTNGEEETVPEAVEFISERMQKAGFATGAFIANGYVSRDFGFNQGWDEFVNFIREKKGTTAKYVYRTAMEWLRKNRNKPFFLYIHTIDPHVPYSVAEEYTSRYYEGDYKGKVGATLGGLEQEELVESGSLTQEDHEWIKALYYGEVTYHDEYMASVLERLKEYDLLEDTLVVISHDHGEELNDHGGLGHRHTLYDELLRGPLLMRFPKRLPRGHVNDELVEYVDLAPTLLDIMGLEPSKDQEGLSMIPLIEGREVPRPRYVVSEFLDDRRAVRVGRWKMIRSDTEVEMLFDIEADPGEQTNLMDKAPVGLRTTQVYLGEALANPNKKKRLLNTLAGKKFTSDKIVVDGELKKQLEALGYFGGK